MLAKLRRFNECAEDSDSGGVDIGRHWLDLLTQLGLLNRVQRSPALWEISQQGEDLLGTPQPSPASDLDPFNLAPHAKAFNEAPAEALKSEQAEAELEKQEPVGEVRESGGTLTAVIVRHSYATKLPVGTKLYAAPVAQAQQLHDLDKQCRDDVARALGLRPSQERGFAWSYLLASIKSCVKASEDAAQAQHSVPAYVSYTTRPAESLAGIALRQLKDESRWVEIRDINAHAFPDMQSHSYYPAGTVIKLPAAAPGKEVGHE
ncbi:LysM peptidoglycan-binding domain-containing protein [Pseudomonas aeruginosa]